MRRLAPALAVSIMALPTLAQESLLRPAATMETRGSSPRFLGTAGNVLAFSRYASNGNDRDTLAVDIRTGTITPLLTGAGDRRLLASDERYLVAGGSGRLTWRLEVLDRGSGRIIAQRGLQESGIWARIIDDGLVLVQRPRRSGEAEVLHYSLPDLQLQRTTKLSIGSRLLEWEDRLLTMRRATGARDRMLVIMDRMFNDVGSMPVPPAERRGNISCAEEEAMGLRVQGRYALLRIECGRLAVYDLAAARLLRVFEIPDVHPDAVTVSADLLFAVAGDETRVHDIATGHELLRVDLPADVLASSGKHILAMQLPKTDKTIRFTVYEPDADAIRSEQARIARIRERCDTGAGDPERSVDELLDRCDTSGIRMYAQGSAVPDVLRPQLDLYAGWLARSLARFAEAAPLLAQGYGGSDRAALAALVDRKLRILRKEPAAGSAPDADRPDVRRISLRNYQALEFTGSLVVAAGNDCGDASERYVDLIDRDTLGLTGSVEVGPCLDGYIASIVTLPGYAAIDLGEVTDENGWVVDEDHHVAVIDLERRQLVARGTIGQPLESLAAWNGRLLRCAGTEPPTRFDPATAAMVEGDAEEAAACANAEPQRVVMDGELARTDHYWVRARPRNGFEFQPLEDSGERQLRSAPRPPYAFVVPARADEVLLGALAEGRFRLRVLLHDMSTGRETALFDLEQLPGTYYGTATWKNLFILARDRDILFYDFERRVVAHYARGFIDDPLPGDGRPDRSRIVRLVVDRDRLIVLTDDQVNSRVIDLPAFTAAFGRGDFFEAAR